MCASTSLETRSGKAPPYNRAHITKKSTVPQIHIHIRISENGCPSRFPNALLLFWRWLRACCRVTGECSDRSFWLQARRRAPGAAHPRGPPARGPLLGAHATMQRGRAPRSPDALREALARTVRQLPQIPTAVCWRVECARCSLLIYEFLLAFLPAASDP